MVAAIRGVGKAAMGHHQMHVIGFRDGFRGLMENRSNYLIVGSVALAMVVGIFLMAMYA